MGYSSIEWTGSTDHKVQGHECSSLCGKSRSSCAVEKFCLHATKWQPIPMFHPVRVHSFVSPVQVHVHAVEFVR